MNRMFEIFKIVGMFGIADKNYPDNPKYLNNPKDPMKYVYFSNQFRFHFVKI